MAEALRALRRDDQPLQARALLEAYLAANPVGSLSEEALALCIEASSKSEPTRAREYARRYLSLYPLGRYRIAAEHALRHER